MPKHRLVLVCSFSQAVAAAALRASFNHQPKTNYFLSINGYQFGKDR